MGVSINPAIDKLAIKDINHLIITKLNFKFTGRFSAWWLFCGLKMIEVDSTALNDYVVSFKQNFLYSFIRGDLIFVRNYCCN